MRIFLRFTWALFTIAPVSATNVTAPPQAEHDNIPIPKLKDIAPPTKEALMHAMRRNVDFLLANQNLNGSWGTHQVIGTENVICPPPSGPLSWRTASTALCIIALRQCPMHDEPALIHAITKAEDYLITALPKLKRSHELCVYEVWAHAYVLEALCLGITADKTTPERIEKLKASATYQLTQLNNLASAQGGWGYLTPDGYTKRPNTDPTSFLTATALIAAHHGQQALGIGLDQKVFARALKFLKSQRTPSGTYVYSRPHTFYATNPINRHMGSLSRSPACDLTQILLGQKDITAIKLEDDLDRLWSRIGWLTMSLFKPTPHESFAQNSGYFFYYGLYYAGMSLPYLPDQNSAKRHAAFLAQTLINHQSDDGSWWDYPLYNYHKFYGSGYALSAIAQAWNQLYNNQ